jgi:hypothetical protein
MWVNSYITGHLPEEIWSIPGVATDEFLGVHLWR